MSAVVININTALTSVPTIEVGKQGENGATQVAFDVSEMIETYGSGTAYVVVQRRGDAEPYLLDNTSQSGDKVTWTVSNVDTDVYGTGRVQLFWLINEQVAKTVTYQFYVEEALHDPQDAPVVPGGWISDEIGNLDNLTTTVKANLVAAINEVNSKATTNTTAIGTLANLTTTEKTNLVGAINEVNEDVSDVKEDLNENTHTFESTNLNDEVYELGRFYADGSNLDGSTDAFRSKNYLPVTGGKTIKYCGEYVLSGRSIANIYVVEYKADKSINVERQILYIYDNITYTTEITLANDTSFIRICVYPFIETYDNTRIKVAYSDVFTPVYEPATGTKALAYEKIADSNGKYIDEIIRDTIDESEESLRIDDINGVEIGKNKFNKNNVVEGYLNVDGTIGANTNYYTSRGIILEKGESYYCRYGERIVSYDNAGNALKLVDGGGLFTMPTDKDYIRVSVLKTLVGVCQIEQGESYGGYAPFERKIESLVCKPNPVVITSPLSNAVIKISSDKSIIVCGVDTESTGIVFANDMTNNALRKVQAQWVSSFNLGYPTGCSFFYKMLKFKNKIYGVGMDELDNDTWKIWRGSYNADATAIVWENTPVWVARDQIVKVSLACDFNCNSDYLFLGEYGFREGNGAKVYRSADGTTWEEIKTLANSIHCHAICPDPYVDGSVWMCSGEAQGYIYHSADNGSTWEIISDVYGFQSCQISFTEDNVYFADDSTQQTATVVNKYAKIPFLLTNDVVNKFGVYGANEGDTYYTNAFYGAVNSDGVYIGVIQDQTSGGNVAGVFRVLELGGHASILKKVEILPTPTGYSLLSEVYQTGTEIYFNQYFMHRPTVKRLSECQ